MKKIAFANAVAFTAGLISVICALGLAFAKDAFIGIINTFVHGIDLGALPVKEFTLGSVISGLIVIVVASWILGYIFAHCYNWCDKRFK